MRYFGFVLVIASVLIFGAATCYGVMGGGGWDLEPVRVMVTRKDTGRPEGGVVVAATWTSSEIASVHGTRPVRVLRRAEAVTDANGLAVIPGAYVDRKGMEKLASSEPQIGVYKRGFVSESLGIGARTFTIRPAEPWEDLQGSNEDLKRHYPRMHLELSSPSPLSRTPPAP